MDLVVATAAQGVLWGLYALGVYLTYRVLDIADLTVEGSFPLGAAVAASMLMAGYAPITAIFAACMAGCVSGCRYGIFLYETQDSRAARRYFDDDRAVLHQPARHGKGESAAPAA